MLREAHCPQCGSILDVEIPRSRPDHNHFFAIVDKAYVQWPEHHSFQPDNSEHLRAFLLKEAGWRHTDHIEWSDETVENERLADILEAQYRHDRKKGVYVFFHLSHSGIYVFRPRSLNCNDVKHKAFQPIKQTVFEIIETAIGVSVDELKKEAA